METNGCKGCIPASLKTDVDIILSASQCNLEKQEAQNVFNIVLRNGVHLLFGINVFEPVNRYIASKNALFLVSNYLMGYLSQINYHKRINVKCYSTSVRLSRKIPNNTVKVFD